MNFSLVERMLFDNGRQLTHRTGIKINISSREISEMYYSAQAKI
jgi:hypothetical protein